MIQPAFLGDAVLALALVQSLKGAHPLARVDYLVRGGHESLFEGQPGVDRLWVWHKKPNKWGNLLRLRSQLRQQGYALVANPHRFASSGFLATTLGARRVVGFDKNPFSWAYDHAVEHSLDRHAGPDSPHEVERNHRLVQAWVPSPARAPKLVPPVAAAAWAARQVKGQPFVLLAPGSVWATKQWPLAHWRVLAAALAPTHRVVVVGSPAEEQLCTALAQGLPLAQEGPGLQVLAGQCSLPQLLALVAQARCVVVNDSGPLHLASATGTPTVALFCSTTPHFGFGPLAPNSMVLQAQPSPPCKPCGLHGKKQCPLQHFACGTQLQPQTVLQQVRARVPAVQAGLGRR